MVVIVANPIFIKRRRTGRLNASDKSFSDQNAESIINRLLGDGSNLGTHIFSDRIHGAMGGIRDCTQYRQTLRRNGDTVLTKDWSEIGHKMDIQKIWNESRTFYSSF